MTTFDGRLVAAGDFLQTPDGVTGDLAAWDGSAWSALGDGPRIRVGALTVYDGKLIVGAAKASLLAGPIVLQWDGESWTSMSDSLVTARVAAFAVYRDQLVACGDFVVPGDLPRHYAAVRWDGASWRPIGPFYGYSSGNVDGQAMTVHDGFLVIGGRFHWASDTTAALVVRWSGTVWDTLALGSSSDEVDALASSDGVLYAGGTLDHLVGGPVARWDGTTWVRLAPFERGVVRTLRPDSVGIVAGGRFTLEDGSVHSTVRRTEDGIDSFPRLEGTVLATTIYDGRLVVAGGDVVALTDDTPVSLLVAQWDDGVWQPIGGRVTGAGLTDFHGGGVAALRVEGDTLIAGGRFSFAREGDHWIRLSNVARWDGTRWHPMGSEIDGTVRAFARYRGSLIAAGAFGGGSGADTLDNIARWDGARWRPFGGGVSGGVAALLVTGDSLVAAGGITSAGGVYVNEVTIWDGTSWAPLGPVYLAGIWAYNKTSSISWLDGALIKSAGPDAYGWRASVSRWDGERWNAMNAGLEIPVAVLHWHEGRLLAGGPGGLEAWTGSSWERYADGAPADVVTLASDRDTLYAGGRFAGVGTIDSPGIARWTGTEWQGLGSGLVGAAPSLNPAAAIARFDDAVFVGGQVATAGGRRSNLIARWGPPRARPAPTYTLAPGRPNPFAHEVAVTFSLARSGHVEVGVLDLAGRRVRTLVNEVLPAGSHGAVWDGADDDGYRARPGVYFVVMRSAGEPGRSRKVVLLR